MTTYGDPLVGGTLSGFPATQSAGLVWFHSFVVAECLVQLPFFFVGVYGIVSRRNWVRWPCVVYGIHVATTLLPILFTLAVWPDENLPKKAQLIAIYLPYLLFPLSLAVRFLVAGSNPYPERAPKKAPRAKAA